MRHSLLVLPMLILMVSTPLEADAPRPVLPKPLGEQCVEPTDVMRERHWEFILHQRDETVHRGIRTTKHSLKNCLECHVRADEAGSYPRASSEQHFCSACHIYAGVRIDCFECHADRPAKAYDALRHHERLRAEDIKQPEFTP